MAKESGHRDAHSAVWFVLAVLALVVWLVMRFTGQVRVNVTESD